MKKAVFITGGSRGIGRAMVECFKKEGWTVATCARKLSSLKEVPADLKLECDVSDLVQVKSAFDEIRSKLGRLDVLINNAGAAGRNSLEPGADPSKFHQIVETNLYGTYYCSHAALEVLPDGGRVINIASVLALKGVPDQTAYCAAKHAVLGFTKALALALAPRRITVNAICPGWVRTEMAEMRMRETGLSEKALEESVPLKRFIEPSEVADFALFLTTDSASAMTGQALTVDGGALA